MHFLAATAEKHYPDVVDFADELIHVDKATRGVLVICYVLCGQRCLFFGKPGNLDKKSGWSKMVGE